MRLRSLRDPRDHLELLLPPPGAARYEFTHEILGDEESFFGGLRVPRGRRVALIFRNDPPGGGGDPQTPPATARGCFWGWDEGPPKIPPQ
uniref:Uncharacterized protein n=1 Tax=Taeniopygia guttata TaxID=59729 RepID=A0A674GQ63_TAEGU